ncbi:hypothetical protein GCM10028820_14890 [Tessaracoccus terricola]
MAPVRRGRVRLAGLSRAARGVVVAAYVSYGLLVVGVLASPVVTALAPARDGMGVVVLGSSVVASGLWVSMVLLFLAALQLPIWWRLAAWLVLLVSHGVLWLFVVLSIITVQGALLPLAAAAASVLAGLVVLVVAVARWSRRPPTVATVVLCVVGLGLTGLLPYVLADPGEATTSYGISALALGFTVLALPVAVAAGTAFAQITVNLATSSLVAVRGRLPRKVWPAVAVPAGVALAALSGYRASLVGPTVVAFTAAQTFGGLGLTALALWAVRGRRGADEDPPRPYALTEVLADVSMALGLAIGSWGLPVVVGAFVQLPPPFRGQMSVWSDLLMAVVALVLLVRAILTGRTLLVVLLPSLLVMGVFAGARTLGGWPSLSTGVASGLLGLVVLGAALAWRRRMDPLRWFLVSLALVVLVVFPFRRQVAEPLGAVLGDTQLLVLLFGLVWLLLTEAEFTHTASDRHGRDSRVFVFLAYAVFSAAMVAAMAYAHPESVLTELNLGDLSNIGDSIIGYAFASAVVVGIIVLGNRGLDVIPPQVTAAARTTAPAASTARR